MKQNLNLIMAGVGGQGNVLASRIIGDAAVAAGYHVVIGETFGAQQRGGAVVSHVRLLKTERYGPLIPAASADLIVGLEPFEVLKSAAVFLKPEGTVVTNECPVMPSDRNYPALEDIFKALKKISGQLFTLDSTAAAKKLGDVATSNMVMIGAAFASGMLPVEEAHLLKAIRDRFAEAAPLNLKAFEQGKKLVKPR